MKRYDSKTGVLQALKYTLLWSDTHLLEICLGLMLLAKATYGAAFRGYPVLMLMSGTLVAIYVLFSALTNSLNHRHRAVSLMSVYYATHIYASAITTSAPPSRVLYLIFTLLAPPLYLKWRIYREQIHRENRI